MFAPVQVSLIKSAQRKDIFSRETVDVDKLPPSDALL